MLCIIWIYCVFNERCSRWKHWRQYWSLLSISGYLRVIPLIMTHGFCTSPTHQSTMSCLWRHFYWTSSFLCSCILCIRQMSLLYVTKSEKGFEENTFAHMQQYIDMGGEYVDGNKSQFLPCFQYIYFLHHSHYLIATPRTFIRMSRGQKWFPYTVPRKGNESIQQ